MTSFDKFLSTALNPSQKKAVTKKDGAILVIAGAGSGKTRVITARMVHQITKQGVDPSEIVALTFTNKAANEMKERLTHFLGEDARLPTVGTFHSYCLRLLRSHPALAPVPNFTILDEDDAKTLIRKIVKTAGIEKQISPSQIKYHISSIKNKMLFSPEEMQTMQPLIRDVYLAYEKEKAASHTVDFDDILLHTLDMFKQHKAFRLTLQSRLSHVLVDEYQDTNIVQHHLLRMIALNDEEKLAIESITAVGDEDQSIYSWRGAAPQNMQKFQDEFAPVTLVKIEQNYRSVQPILEAANRVIANNTMRHPKELWSDKKAKGRILSLTCRSDYQEAEALCTFLESMPKGKTLNDVAILYRTHAQSRVIEEILAANGVPYQIIGGIHFYGRKEIKDLLAYLRLVVNPHDRVSFMRVINYPLRGLGQKFQELALDCWLREPFINFKDVLGGMLENPEMGVTGKKATSLKQFLSIFDHLDKSMPPSKILGLIIKETSFLSYLQDSLDPKEAEAKVDNVRELIRSVDFYESQKKNADDSATLDDFLAEIALLQEKIESQDHEEERVQMMTLHAAKGLEFDTIFLVGLEESIFPSGRSLNSFEALEEERRLFYVGMTRAKERLVLSHALFRNQYGQINNQEISRFLDEVPARLVQTIDLSQQSSQMARRIFSCWLDCRPLPDLKVSQKSPSSFSGKKTATTNNFTAYPSRKFESKPKTKSNFSIPSSGWHRNQQIEHPSFGSGIIVEVKKRSSDEYFITAIFRTGKKKVLSTHLKKTK